MGLLSGSTVSTTNCFVMHLPIHDVADMLSLRTVCVTLIVKGPEFGNQVMLIHERSTELTSQGNILAFGADID